MKKYAVLIITILLSACGTTSHLRNANKSPELPNFSHYKTVIVNDFKDGIKKEGDQQKSKNISLECKRFADIIADSLRKENIFEKVERNKLTKNNALLIDGQITEYEEGNSALRFMVGFGAGSSHFDAKVDFKDNMTKKLLGEIEVDKQSWALGGAIAGSQDPKSHMESAAEKIAEEVKKAKTSYVSIPSTTIKK